MATVDRSRRLIEILVGLYPAFARVPPTQRSWAIPSLLAAGNGGAGWAWVPEQRPHATGHNRKRVGRCQPERRPRRGTPASEGRWAYSPPSGPSCPTTGGQLPEVARLKAWRPPVIAAIAVFFLSFSPYLARTVVGDVLG